MSPWLTRHRAPTLAFSTALWRLHWQRAAAMVLAALTLTGAAAISHAADDAQPPLNLQQVSPHGYFVEGLTQLGSPQNQNFISNAGFVVTTPVLGVHSCRVRRTVLRDLTWTR